MAVQKGKKKRQTSKLTFFTSMTKGQLSLLTVAIVFGLVGIYTIYTSSALTYRGGHNSATLAVTPDPSKLGYVSLVVSGCGYDPGSWVTLNYYPVNAPGATFSLGFAGTETADSAGCISVAPFTKPFTSVSGTYGFKAYRVEFDKNNHKHETLMAQTVFEVQP